jgi:Holliday junction resolvasome RuvABC endonuclease subunit
MAGSASAVWGVDYGVRAFYAARIEPDRDKHEAFSVVLPKGMTRSQELAELSTQFAQLVDGEAVFIEEPVVAGVRNLRTSLQLAQTAGALMSRTTGMADFVPVSSWKIGTVGRGNADKTSVSEWLSMSNPAYFELCGGDQNRVDATCIALWAISSGVLVDGDG